MNTDRKPAELKLVNGAETITVRPMIPAGADPIICKVWDIGSPEFRYTTVANPGADGTSYSDGFVGARTVTFELAIMGGLSKDDHKIHDAYWYANRLAAMTHPMAKPQLKIRRDDETSLAATIATTGSRPVIYTMDLRGSPYSLPYTARSAALLEMQLVFVCPLGLIDGPLLTYTTLDRPDDDDAYDWVFPAKFDKKFGFIYGSFPRLIINVGGDAIVSPVLYISGPCTNPHVIAGEDQFRFDSLTLAAGQTVQVDMGTGDIRLGTTTGTILDDMTVYNTVDWSVSTFWRWLPGVHDVYYLNSHGTLSIQFHERRLTI